MIRVRDNIVTALCATLITGILYALSCDIGPLGPAVLIAPIPILVYAITSDRLAWVFASAFLARLIGTAAFVYAYAGALPAPALIISTILMGVEFALLVLLARWSARRLPAWIATLSFAIFTVALEFLVQSVSPHGSFGAIGYALIDIGALTQIASIGGVLAVSFMAALIPMSIALLLCRPNASLAIASTCCIPLAFALAFGVWRLSQPYEHHATVGLASVDSLTMRALQGPNAAQQVNEAYGELLRSMTGKNLAAIVLPERVFVDSPVDHSAALMLQRAADDLQTRIIAGFDETDASAGHRNTARVFTPRTATLTYTKRKLIPGLESDLNPGTQSLLFDERGVAICKDMDFPALLRDYGVHGAALMFVPAWDFKRDGRLHARMAVMRGIENGFALVRSAATGRLTVSDAFGRVIAETTTSAEKPSSLIAEVGLVRSETLYSRIGDAFGWFDAITALALLCWLIAAMARRRAPASETTLTSLEAADV
jgi:apolipoprotein N-acyltransferase